MPIIFITGGARSGKSTLAVQLAKNLKGKVAFIATAQAGDDEMAERISKHKSSRPKAWKTFEEPIDIPSVIAKAYNYDTIIIDCLTILVSNLLLDDDRKNDDDEILNRIVELSEIAKNSDGTMIVVSNEVGMGIVPDNKLARRFRDLAGRANQIIAESADEVYICFSGIPVKIK